MSNRTVPDRVIDLEVMMNRRVMIDALKSGKRKQRVGSLGDWFGIGSVCWNGLGLALLCDVYGPYERDKSSMHGSPEWFTPRAFRLDKKLGISRETVVEFIQANDHGGLCFRQLGYMLEQLPPAYKDI